MKADELINLYNAGRRDFSGEKLRGQNFARQNLSQANFSHCDIRGANFKGANLTGANFTGATAGLQKCWMIGLLLVTLPFLGLSGVFSAITAAFVSYIFKGYTLQDQVSGWTSLLIVLILCIASYFRGLIGGLVAVTLVVASAVAVGGVGVGVRVGILVFAGLGAGSGAFTVVAVGVATGAGAAALAVASAGLGAGLGAVTLAVAGALAVAGTLALVLALVAALAGALEISSAVAGALGGALTLFSCYLAYRAMKGDPKDAWIKNFAVAFAATGGTTFKKANLTDANFTEATLKSTDFRDAILIRTCFKNTEKLDRIRPGKTYLSNTNLKQWLIGEGTNKNFDRQDLRGVHLQAANLTDASFIGADLSNANLQDVDLSRAKLIQTQLDNTDLTGATLTGATIEDWGITSHTNLRGVRCNYIFMKESTTADPNPRRKPDNWEEEFEDGDFAEFIQPLVNTLDLYHNQGIDPRAIAIAFKQLAEEHPDAELQIVAIEKRGNDKLLIRVC